MATQFELQAIITALDKASKVFGTVGASAKKSGGTIKSAFSGAGTAFGKVRAGIGKVDGALQKMGQQIPAVQAAFGGLQQAMDLGRLGASFERVEDRFNKFAEAAGGGEAIFEAFQRGVGGAAGKMDTMSISAGLLQSGLVGNAAEMERVTEIASRLGDQTIGVSDRIGEFSALLKNQSIELLDNFGISSGKVRSRIAELQAETKGMSRETAFLTATFEEADKALAILGPRTEDSLTSFERMDAQMADLKLQIGQQLMPATAALMQLFSQGVSIVSSLIDVFGGLAGGVSDLVSSVPILGDAFDAVFGALDVEAAAKTAEQLAILADSSKVAEGTITEWGAATQEAMSQGASLGDAMTTLGEKTRDASKAFDEGGIIADIFVDQTGILSDAAEEAGQIALETAQDYEEYTGAIDSFNAVVPDATAKVDALSQAQFNARKGIEDNTLTYSEFFTTLSTGAAAMTDTVMAQMEQEQALNRVTRESLGLSAATEQQIELQERATQTAFDQAEALENSAEFNAELALRQEVAAGSADRAAAAAERQAAGVQAAAAALEAKRQKDIATAQTEADLAQSMVDVTDAALAQTFIQGLDPEAMGLTAYQAAVEQIQLSFGLATPESIALSRGITQGLDAANAGAIAYKDLDQFILALKEDAADGSVDFDTLSRTFASSSAQADFLSQRITATGDAITDNVAKTEALVAAEAGLEGVTKQAHDQMVGFGDVLPNIAAANQTWTDSVTGSTHALVAGQATAQQWQSTVAGLDSRLLATGESLLSTGEKIESVNALFERGAAPAEDTAASVDEVAAAHAAARVPIEEFTGAVSEIPEGMDAAANAAPDAAIGVTDFGIASGEAVDSVSKLAAAARDLGSAMSGVGSPGAAAAGAGAAGSGGGGFPTFQTGGVMPYTGLANLHAGEIVLPPGSGTVTKNYTLNIHTAAPIEPIMRDFATLEAMG